MTRKKTPKKDDKKGKKDKKSDKCSKKRRRKSKCGKRKRRSKKCGKKEDKCGKKGKKGKKGGKKKPTDPFLKKDWYDIKAPKIFQKTHVGKTVVTRTQGNKIASDALKGRVLQTNLADIHGNEAEHSHTIIKLRIEDVQGNQCLTNFHGMQFTTDKLKSLIKKWQSLIEATVDVKTADGVALRLFAIGFTKRRSNQIKKTTYAQSSQIKQIRKKMVDVMTKEATSGELKDLFSKFVTNSIGDQIIKECNGIFPLQNVFVRKVKLLKVPKVDPFKLLELHGLVGEDAKKL